MYSNLQNLGTGEAGQRSEEGFRKRFLGSKGGKNQNNPQTVADTWPRLTQLWSGGCGLVVWDTQGTGHQT